MADIAHTPRRTGWARVPRPAYLETPPSITFPGPSAGSCVPLKETETVYERGVAVGKWNLWNALILDELQASKFHKKPNKNSHKPVKTRPVSLRVASMPLRGMALT